MFFEDEQKVLGKDAFSDVENRPSVLAKLKMFKLEETFPELVEQRKSDIKVVSDLSAISPEDMPADTLFIQWG